MVVPARAAFNAAFSDQQYQTLLRTLTEAHGRPVLFRVAETPVFVPRELKNRLLAACDGIVAVLTRSDFMARSEAAVPTDLRVPSQNAHPNFIAIDFAICRDEAGQLTPQLIELQGFPSLYGFQTLLSGAFRQLVPVPPDFSPYFSGLDEADFVALLRQTILGRHAPQHVVLLEIEPERQKTNVDFFHTQALTGVQPVCISEVIKEGPKLFYRRRGVKTPIHRIYNRVIFDELLRRSDLPRQFDLTDELDVEWAGHPNWFFRISKATMPLLTGPYVPPTAFLSDFNTLTPTPLTPTTQHIIPFPTDPENYVLKPLYSFAGAGVLYDVTAADLAAIPAEARAHYVLQRKVHYAPVVEAADGGMVKTEIRMLYLWPDDAPQPTLAINLARLSRGVMIGVDFNKNKTFVGGTVAFFEP